MVNICSENKENATTAATTRSSLKWKLQEWCPQQICSQEICSQRKVFTFWCQWQITNNDSCFPGNWDVIQCICNVSLSSKAFHTGHSVQENQKNPFFLMNAKNVGYITTFRQHVYTCVSGTHHVRLPPLSAISWGWSFQKTGVAWNMGIRKMVIILIFPLNVRMVPIFQGLLSIKKRRRAIKYQNCCVTTRTPKPIRCTVFFSTNLS